VIGEIERVLATPLPELMDSPQDRAHAQELARQADAAAAIGRFRVLLGFVGSGRRATQSGKLTPSDAVELAAMLGVPGAEDGEVRSMEDLPEVAQLFDWAVASELLVTRGTRVLPGMRAEDLSGDPLAAWFKAAMALLEHGLLGASGEGGASTTSSSWTLACRICWARCSTRAAMSRSPLSRISSGSKSRKPTITNRATPPNTGVSTASSTRSSLSLPTSEPPSAATKTCA
jgi:hypothetical protein